MSGSESRFHVSLRRSAGAHDKHDRRRKACAERDIDAGRALDALRSGAADDSGDRRDPDRDRFLVSKGHGPMALYAVLAAKGFIPCEWLTDFGRFGLASWPAPGTETSFPVSRSPAVRSVTVSRSRWESRLPSMSVRRRGARVFVLLGDAELDEGSNHEAIALAGRMRLERLTAIVVDNASAAHGWPGGIEARFAIEGWETAVVDGHDHSALASAFTVRSPGRPRVVVAHAEPKEG